MRSDELAYRRRTENRADMGEMEQGMKKRLGDRIAGIQVGAAHKWGYHVQKRKAGERKAMDMLQVGCCEGGKQGAISASR